MRMIRQYNMSSLYNRENGMHDRQIMVFMHDRQVAITHEGHIVVSRMRGQVQGLYYGKWICGLCAEMMKEECYTS